MSISEGQSTSIFHSSLGSRAGCITRRNFRAALGLALAGFGCCLTASCEAAAEPAAVEVYSAVLAEISRKLELPRPVLLHPLLGKLDSEAEGKEPMREFLVWDTVTVPAVVERNSGSYRRCDLNRVGNCATPSEPWVMLSEIHDLGGDVAVLVLVIRDPRSDRDALRTYRARVGYRSGGGMSIRIDPIR